MKVRKKGGVKKQVLNRMANGQCFMLWHPEDDDDVPSMKFIYMKTDYNFPDSEEELDEILCVQLDTGNCVLRDNDDEVIPVNVEAVQI